MRIVWNRKMRKMATAAVLAAGIFCGCSAGHPTSPQEDGTIADGLSTSIFVMGLEKAAEYWKNHSGSFEMIVMNREGELYATEGLRNRFTSGLPIHWITK